MISVARGTTHLATVALASLALFPHCALAADRSPRPALAADGSLLYVYGRSQPTAACRPLFICDVALEPGEAVLNVAIGDSVRWVIASAQSGEGGSTPHVFVKPTELGLKTNLLITTSKRVYDVLLVSRSVATNPRISFSYPEEAAAAAAAAAAKKKLDDESAEIPLLPPDKLDTKYSITGAPEIAPARVFNDGVHTFLEFGSLPTDFPALFAVDANGTQQIVNYRLRERTIIVDGIQPGFDLVLNAGTGRHGRDQRTVNIRRN